MIERIFRQNLKTLAALHPDVAASLPSSEQWPADYAWSQDSHSLRVDSPARCVVDRSARLKIDLPPGEPEPLVILMGSGLGDGLRDAWKRVRSLGGRLYVIERDPWIFRAALSSSDLKEVLAAREIGWAIGLRLEEVTDRVRRLAPTMGKAVLVRGQSAAACPSYYGEMEAALEPILLQREQNRRFTLDQRGRIELNTFLNLPFLVRSLTLDALQGSLQGVPGYVIAAGPSLDRNIRQLAGIGDRGFLLAVDTALGPLLRERVAPHAVITVDPTELAYEHFRTVPSLGSTALFFTPSSCPKVLRRYGAHERLVAFGQEGSLLLDRLRLCIDLGKPVPRGAMVGQYAFNVARLLGCSPLILVGMDLAFPAEGKTHCAGAALARSTTSTPSGILFERSGLLEQEEAQPVRIPGIAEPEVITTEVFLNYLRRLEAEIASTRVPVFDATEGGARKAGTVPVALHEVTEQHTSPVRVSNLVDTWFRRHRMPDVDRLEVELDRMAQVVSRAAAISQSLLKEAGRGNSFHALHGLEGLLRNQSLEIITDTFMQYLRYRTAQLKIRDQADSGSVGCLLEESLDKLKIFISVLRSVRNELAGASDCDLEAHVLKEKP